MQRFSSLRLRIIASAALLLILFEVIFCLTLFQRYRENAYFSEYEKLQSDVATLLSLARFHEGKAVMPERTPNDEFLEIESDLLGAVLDKDLNLLWSTISAHDENVKIGEKISLPTSPLFGDKLFGTTLINNKDFFYFAVNHDSEHLVNDYYFVALHSKAEFDEKIARFWKMVIWLGLALIILATLLTASILWGLSPLKRIDKELNELGEGSRDRLSSAYPSEVSGITVEFNQLLDRERKQKERYKNTLSDLAHSLKTPVAVLKLLIERAPGEESSPERREFIQSSSYQLQQMSAIIQYQLKRAMISGNKRIGDKPFRPQPLLTKLCANLAKIQVDRQVNWHLSCDEHIELPINRQDFFEFSGNLLENAFRLSHSEVHITLQLGTSKIGEEMTLKVEDDGPGVPDDCKDKIMERGIRADRRTPGHGLGLAIIKDIVDDYEGTLSVKDSRLGGALFTITIPTKFNYSHFQ